MSQRAAARPRSCACRRQPRPARRRGSGGPLSFLDKPVAHQVAENPSQVTCPITLADGTPDGGEPVAVGDGPDRNLADAGPYMVGRRMAACACAPWLLRPLPRCSGSQRLRALGAFLRGGDYGPAAQHGFAKPRQVLRSVLAADPWLSQDGWVAASRAVHAVDFRSGNDSVDIVKRSDGEWVVGAVTACQ